MPRKLKLMLLLAWLTCMQANASKPDSLRHIGYSIGLQPAQVVSWDKYSTKFIKKKNVLSFMAEANYTALPSDSNAIDADFGYPSLSIGFRYSLNDVTFHRSPDPAWGLAEEVDYDSNMGGIATLYSTFTRPFFRHQHWSADYTLGTGIGYTRRIYNNTDNIDNELLGTRWLIYFTAGLHATWHFAPKWGLRMGLDFYHHSNGALYRPNKGANVLGPTIGLSYEPNYDYLSEQKSGTYFSKQPFRPYFFTKITAGIGGKALHEDWQLTQFGTPKGEEDYRTEDFTRYITYSTQLDFMYRYARRWASGIGFDFFHISYTGRVREIDEASNRHYVHKPWSMGIAAKHEVYYRRLTVNMSIGTYLYRKLGYNASIMEHPVYERIGVQYAIPGLGGLTVGFAVKAHDTKADLTELLIAMPVKLKSRKPKPPQSLIIRRSSSRYL